MCHEFRAVAGSPDFLLHEVCTPRLRVRGIVVCACARVRKWPAGAVCTVKSRDRLLSRSSQLVTVAISLAMRAVLTSTPLNYMIRSTSLSFSGRFVLCRIWLNTTASLASELHPSRCGDAVCSMYYVFPDRLRWSVNCLRLAHISMVSQTVRKGSLAALCALSCELASTLS